MTNHDEKNKGNPKKIIRLPCPVTNAALATRQTNGSAALL